LLSTAKAGISNRMPNQGSSAAAGLSLFWLAVNTAVADSRENFRGWEVYGGDPAGKKYSALDQINRTNIQRLKPVWIYRCDDMRLRPASTIECNPIVVDGVMFLTTPGLKVVALDAATGR
jgi:quinoprotein glucose dehydrogenase